MYKVRPGGDQPDIAALGHSGNLSQDCVYFVSFHIANEPTYPALIEWFDATKELRYLWAFLQSATKDRYNISTCDLVLFEGDTEVGRFKRRDGGKKIQEVLRSGVQGATRTRFTIRVIKL
jgi:hypothetical protein